jgi:membrane-associated phospholipid phosphatase
LVITAGYYLRFRAEPKLGSALSGTAQIAAFAAVGAPLSYIAASAGLPLWDDKLVIWDRHLGLDWMAWLAAMNAHPNLHLAFHLAYMSFAVQTTTTVLALAFTNRLIHLRVFIISFMLATVVTIAISTLMPAQGVWGQLHLVTSDYPNIAPATQTSHLAVFLGLRDGSFRELMAQGSEGIITFPSLHAALGLLFMLAMWPVPYLRWVAIVLNLLMIAATPVDGGHYFTDVVAGLAIAAFCRIAATRLIEKRLSAAMEEVNVTEAPSIIPDTSTVSEYPAEALPQSDSRKPLKAT